MAILLVFGAALAGFCRHDTQIIFQIEAILQHAPVSDACDTGCRIRQSSPQNSTTRR
uniref:Uncharacterized protein n=1 Tax=mine drainage metagenome TaxID=410659 RepID=E6QJ55_9ZZZZ